MNGISGAWRTRVQRGVMIFLALALLALPAAASAKRTVLVFGDSLSAGYGLAANQGWVELTAQRMRGTHPTWRVINASISGETTAGGAARIVAEIARTKPDVVVIELGANDGLRGLDLAQTRANLDKIIRSAQAGKAKVLLIGMRMPPNFGTQYTRAFEQNYSLLAKRHGTAYLPFLLAPIAADRNAFQQDNMHPVAQVQGKLRDHVWVALAPLLK
jgi:acyl-CoA thioesterase-1